MEKLITTREAAKRLNISTNRLMYWIRKGVVKAKAWRFGKFGCYQVYAKSLDKDFFTSYCLFCGKVIKGKRISRKYCCPKHKAAYHRSLKKLKNKRI